MRDIYERIKSKGGRVYIFGAGQVAKMVIDDFFEVGLGDSIEGILVTSKEHNPNEIRGIEVMDINDVNDIQKKLIYIATGFKKQDVIKEALLKRSVSNENIYVYEIGKQNVYSLQKIIKLVENSSDKAIYIYGTGKVASQLIRLLKELNLENNIKGFVVTKMDDLTEFYDYPVYEMSKDLVNDNSIFVVGTVHRFVNSIMRNLNRFGVKDESIFALQFYAFYVLDQQERIIKAKPKIKKWFGDKYYLSRDNHDITYGELHMKKDDGEDFSIKLDPFIIEPQFPYYVKEWHEYDMFSEYIKEFGRDLRFLKANEFYSGTFDYSKYFAIYMISSHKDYSASIRNTDRFLIPIQAGAALAEEKKYTTTDDAGADNISNQNRTLCELTAIYWVWKNSEHKAYKGVCHYRRHFDLEERDYQKIIDDDVDVVLTTPRLNAYGNLNTFLMGYLVAPIDIDLVKKTIAEVYPEYIDSMNEHFNQKFFFNCNMVIAKETIFNEYCEFLFGVVLPLDNYFRDAGIERTNKFSAYFAELISSLFFFHNRNRWNIKTTDLIFYE